MRASNAPLAPPKAPELILFCPAKLAPGSLKFTLFSRLNDSARNCTAARSVILKFLNRDMSMSKKFGPVKVLRPRLPTQPRQGLVNVGGVGPAALNQPSAHCAREGLKSTMLESGRSILSPSR